VCVCLLSGWPVCVWTREQRRRRRRRRWWRERPSRSCRYWSPQSSAPTGSSLLTDLMMIDHSASAGTSASAADVTACHHSSSSSSSSSVYTGIHCPFARVLPHKTSFRKGFWRNLDGWLATDSNSRPTWPIRCTFHRSVHLSSTLRSGGKGGLKWQHSSGAFSHLERVISYLPCLFLPSHYK